jgi:argininosuccinate lyase
MDTSGDRDYAIEFTSCCTMIQLHLSRLSEELVLWSSQEFDFVDISDRFCTRVIDNAAEKKPGYS